MVNEKIYYHLIIKQIGAKMSNDWGHFCTETRDEQEDLMIYQFLYSYVDIDKAVSILESELKKLFLDRKIYPEFFHRILDRAVLKHTWHYIERLGVQKEFLKNLVAYYCELKQYKFADYENVIIYLFFYSQGLTINDLERMTIADTYIETACFALSYAGEPGELGRAYYGGQAIRENCQYLDESVLDTLLQCNIDDNEMTNGVRYQIRYMLQMILYSSLQDREPNIYKFVYIDRYQLHYHLARFFRDFFDGKYPDSVYQHGTKNEVLVNKEYQGKSIQFVIDRNATDRRDEIVYLIVEPDKISRLRVWLGQDTVMVQIDNERLEEFSFMPKEERLIYQQIERVCNKLLSVDVSREYLELLYLYVDNLYSKGRQYKLAFSHEYYYDFIQEDDKKYIYVGWEDHRTPIAFFYNQGRGKGSIRNINALIGRNGSGKTSVAKLLTESEIFGIRDREEQNQYCVIFKIGNNLYWVTNMANMEVKVSDTDIRLSQLGENFEQFQNIMNTTVVSYNNFLNPLSVGVFKQTVSRPIESVMRYSLTTPELLARDLKGSLQTDILRVANLYEDLEEQPKDLGIVNLREVYLYADRKVCEKIDSSYQKACKKAEIGEWLYWQAYRFYEYDWIEGADHDEVYNGLPIELYCKWYIKRIIEKRKVYRQTDLSEKEMEEIKMYLTKRIDNYQKLNCRYCGDVMEERSRSGFYKWRMDWQNIVQCHIMFGEMLQDIGGFFFEFPQMSMGESARLLLFARLHSVFHVRQEYRAFLPLSSEQRNFILVLDEIEAFFHPVWQREIVYDLIDFLEWESEKFDAYDNVHLILSSNAPFFLSDLPKDSLICLDEEAVGQEQNYSSFGQNIHTILKNSFLLEDGLMGKFAQQKIESAFAILQKNEVDSESLEEVEYIVNELEEPIIKHALMQLLERAKEQNMGFKERELAKYKRQAAELQEKINKLQNDID